jgi:hypothetical protein
VLTFFFFSILHLKHGPYNQAPSGVQPSLPSFGGTAAPPCCAALRDILVQADVVLERHLRFEAVGVVLAAKAEKFVILALTVRRIVTNLQTVQAG